MSAASARVPRATATSLFDPAARPVVTVAPGATVVVETEDARGGALLDQPVGSLFPLPRATPARANPLSGPIAVRAAGSGDSLVVTIERIELESPGWCGGHAHVGPLEPGRIPRPLGRICPVEGGQVRFSNGITLEVAAMIGSIGTAPAGEAAGPSAPGRYGGNLDQPPVREGARVHLPVFVPDGLLFVGDVHACQGDGELAGVALEIRAEVTLRIELERQTHLTWPWVENDGRIAVMTAAESFATARRRAVEAMLHALESQLGLEPAEGLALISVTGDLRIGQAFGGMPLTLRLELPASLGIRPC